MLVGNVISFLKNLKNRQKILLENDGFCQNWQKKRKVSCDDGKKYFVSMPNFFGCRNCRGSL